MAADEEGRSKGRGRGREERGAWGCGLGLGFDVVSYLARCGVFSFAWCATTPRAARCGGIFSLAWYRALEAFVVTTTLGGFIC